jgi:hypothetical protein
MTREQMMTEVIHKYGFEHSNTIWFAKCVEKDTDEELSAAFEVAMNDKEDWDFL